MGARERISDLGRKFQPPRQRQGAGRDGLAGPIAEITLRAPLDLDEVGRGLQIPIEETREIAAPLETGAQQAKQRDLALQARDLIADQGELEDPALVRLVMFAEPCIAIPASAQASDQFPVRPSDNTV